MRVHLVDATYELFRAHFSPRPTVRGRDGVVLSGVSGLAEQLCVLLGAQGATHVACATDQVIRSFRNDLYAGYKTDAGVPADLLAQFPIAEAAMAALGVVVWPMVEFEADDAIGAAALRFAADPRVEQVVICTPDKDMAQCVVGSRVVLWDRRRAIVYDEAGVVAKWGVPPSGVADRLALVGDAADGFPGLPGWGDKSASAVLSRYGGLEAIPADAADWDVPGLRGAPALAAVLRERMDDALLFRSLATLRTSADGVPIPQTDVDELAWQGADRARWEAFCAEWGLPRLANRPPRWLA
jgi:5'-3' exonuclease